MPGFARMSAIVAAMALASCSEPTSDGDRAATAQPAKANLPLVAFRTIQSAVAPPPLEGAQRRSGFVAFDSGTLASATASRQAFAVSLFGRTFNLEPAPSRRASPENVWLGRIQEPGQPNGRALVIQNGGDVYVKLYTADREYAVLSRIDGSVLAIETDIEALPDESEPERDEASALAGARTSTSALQVRTIEVLLLYDQTLKARLDALPDGVANFVRDRQFRLDEVYLDGANGLDVNVVVKAHGLYDGKSSQSPIAQSAALRDWPKFNEMRDKHGVDLVALLVDNLEGSCGIAPLGGTRSTTDHKCEGKWTVAHEIGHNLDAEHSRPAGNTDTKTCNFGYRVPGIARTVMAYACKGKACKRRPYFSDVRLRHGSAVMGKVCGKSDGAENVHVVRKNIPIVAAYRS